MIIPLYQFALHTIALVQWHNKFTIKAYKQILVVVLPKVHKSPRLPSSPRQVEQWNLLAQFYLFYGSTKIGVLLRFILYMKMRSVF